MLEPGTTPGDSRLSAPHWPRALSMSEPTPTDDAPSAEISGGGYRIALPMFEGPLDLLLHLIQKHELDILDIPIGFVTEKYLEYIQMMEELSIDIASEYLVMSATLVHIKSRSLLPPDPSQADDPLDLEEEDPSLLEYQKYKQAAEEIGSRDLLGRDVFPRGLPMEATAGPAPLADVSVFRLMDAFQRVLERARRVEDHQIDFDRITITEKISELNQILQLKRTARFEELFGDAPSRLDVIVTFLALLEMTRLRMTRISQADPDSPIIVELRADYADESESVEFGSSETGSSETDSSETGSSETDSSETDSSETDSSETDDEQIGERHPEPGVPPNPDDSPAQEASSRDETATDETYGEKEDEQA
jgi:segregation and condensation protein A